ncbi:hypothetical protein YC2023_040970 [Brassica napus]
MKSTYSILYEHLQYIIYLAEDELKAISLEVQIYLNNNDQNIISYNQTLDESGGKKEHVKSQLYLGINLLSTITKAIIPHKFRKKYLREIYQRRYCRTKSMSLEFCNDQAT